MVGFVEETPDYHYYISRRVHGGRRHHAPAPQGVPADVRHVHRPAVFGEGERIEAFDASFGRCGLLICEDIWHNSTVSILAADRANYVISINSSPGRGVVTGDRTLGSSDAVEMLNRMYAQFFTSFVIFCNRRGLRRWHQFLGRLRGHRTGWRVPGQGPLFRRVADVRGHRSVSAAAGAHQPATAAGRKGGPHRARVPAHPGGAPLRPSTPQSERRGDGPHG